MGVRVTADLADPQGRRPVASRAVAARPEVLYSFLTHPIALCRWALPPGATLVTCESDVAAGGTLNLVWCEADGVDRRVHGHYLDVAAPDSISALLDVVRGDAVRSDGMVVTVRLAALGESTRATWDVGLPRTGAAEPARLAAWGERLAAASDRLAALVESEDGRRLVRRIGRVKPSFMAATRNGRGVR